MISFVAGPVVVRIRREPGKQYQEVRGMIALNTPYAYHPVPEGTVLFERLPDALMITEQRHHCSVTGSLLPADPATAEACIAYLVEQANSQASWDTLIERFAQMQGKWCRLPA